MKRSAAAATGHTEVVRVFFDPARVSYDDLLRVFWEGHDPTQGMRQHGDVGTQYRSAIYYFDEDQRAGRRSVARRVSGASTASGYGDITTEIAPAPTFYFAEEYHQQYLAKNPNGYCGHGGTGVSCAGRTRSAPRTRAFSALADALAAAYETRERASPSSLRRRFAEPRLRRRDPCARAGRSG